MKITGRLVCLLAFLLSATVYGFTPGRVHRIAILETAEQHQGRMERAISESMPRVLVEELRRLGFEARMLRRTIDEISPGEASFDLLVEFVDVGADGGFLGGAGVGAEGVGAEVGMIWAEVRGRVLVYDGASLALLRSLDLQARTTAPALTGVGVGGRGGFLFVRLPFGGRLPEKRITRALARDAARRIVAQ